MEVFQKKNIKGCCWQSLPRFGSGEIVQWWSACAALPGDTSSVSAPAWAAPNALSSLRRHCMYMLTVTYLQIKQS